MREGTLVSKLKYVVPDTIKTQCSRAKYSRWLQRKTAAHVKRDREKATRNRRYPTNTLYAQMIHSAVLDSKGRDFYTGEPLDWSLISKWDNASANRGKGQHKKAFALLPTVDHTEDEQGTLIFVICAYYVNDAKSNLTLKEFYQLCERVLEHRKRKAGNGKQPQSGNVRAEKK
jgi:hypothetical protein